MQDCLQAFGEFIGCRRCWRRSRAQHVKYEGPFLFELVDSLGESDLDEYELRRTEDGVRCRKVDPFRVGEWMPVSKRNAVCERCKEVEPEVLYMVYDVQTGALDEGQSNQGSDDRFRYLYRQV